jgi:hypothetical protein
LDCRIALLGFAAGSKQVMGWSAPVPSFWWASHKTGELGASVEHALGGVAVIRFWHCWLTRGGHVVLSRS